MNAASIPLNADVSPLEITVVVLLELLFGLGFNLLVAYWQRHQLMHISIAVAIGITGTVLFPALFWCMTRLAFWEAGVLLGLCFTASGVPMIVGSMRRSVNKKDQKRRRPWPTAALRVRDDVVMELTIMATEIATKSRGSTLTINDLPDYVHRLYIVINMLRSV